MKILALDTTTSIGSVAFAEDDKLINSKTSEIKASYSERLMPLMDDLLKEAKVSIKDIGLFVVTIGPGSFTGLRIGLATVKGLAFPRMTPIIGLSSLEAMAYSLKNKPLVHSVYDALRGELFYASFNTVSDVPKRLSEDRIIKTKDFLKNNKDGDIIVGNGILDFKSKIPSPKAEDFIKLGYKHFLEKKCIYDTYTLEPNYLQDSYAGG